MERRNVENTYAPNWFDLLLCTCAYRYAEKRNVELGRTIGQYRYGYGIAMHRISSPIPVSSLQHMWRCDVFTASRIDGLRSPCESRLGAWQAGSQCVSPTEIRMHRSIRVVVFPTQWVVFILVFLYFIHDIQWTSSSGTIIWKDNLTGKQTNHSDLRLSDGAGRQHSANNVAHGACGWPPLINSHEPILDHNIPSFGMVKGKTIHG